MTHTRDESARSAESQVVGLILAAGGGRRLGGRPKALLEHRGRPLVEHAVRTLRTAGCTRVHVVLGAAADAVRERARLDGCVLVENPDWAQGMGTSLRAGLASLPRPAPPAGPPAVGARTGEGGARTGEGGAGSGEGDARAEEGGARAVLVLLVDQPGIGPQAVARVLAAYGGESSLVSAAYDGERGHPVLFGARHWAGVAATATGDRGARAYLGEHREALTLVECGDVARPFDIDTPEDLAHLE
ncbi:4-diphosphocytidyl-2C-methyl-D-erythritol synthase [Streptomyces sp. P3]|uniref:nucleotidyltransferase family protein n=2 Tax=unclassified Streptomyces TaxID=2593676 RepID=UPI000D1BBE76|nr:nucleotidyltransferase family protein [Streptomyces sp. P3]AVV45078.1 4-diphosphocytidyl-2C-methyl-D-erythritol synthase [Streptomyces sp. P3]